MPSPLDLTCYSQRIVSPHLVVSEHDDAHYRELVLDQLVRFARENELILGEGVVTRTLVADGDSDVAAVDSDDCISHIGHYRYRAAAPCWKA